MARPACRGAAALLTAFVAAAMIASVSGHGFLKKPAPRNVLASGRNGFYQPMSLNREGAGVCGGLNGGDGRFSVGGEFAERKITGHYRSGGVIEVEMNVWVNHWGWFDIRLCPLSNPGIAAEKRELNEHCLSQHKLKQANGKGSRHWINHGLRSANFIEKATYRLPKGVKCKRCVLQWRWVTGHMCRPPGWDPSFVTDGLGGLHNCPADYLSPHELRPEKFYNCADIRIH